MPRKDTSRGAASAFQQVQRQARTLLLNLRKEIRLKESVLSKLKQEEARLGSLIGRVGGSAKSVSSGPTGRVNWRAVLSALPKQFKAADVRFSNMECCLYAPPGGHTWDNEGFYAAPDAAGESLKYAGIDVVGIANNVNYGDPNTTIGQSSTGQITYARAARIMQLALKYSF